MLLPHISSVVQSSWIIADITAVLCLLSQYVGIGNGNWFSKTIDELSRYGKQTSGHINILGQLRYFYVPKRLFKHFYVASTLWSLTLLICLIYALLGSGFSATTLQFLGSADPTDEIDKVSLVLCFILVFIQGSRRLYECTSVSKFSEQNINIFQYFLGLYFYIAEPLAILSKVGPLETVVTGRFGTRHIFGIVLFMLGSYVQHDAFRILAEIRKAPGAKNYAIPHGGLFYWVSCPHYFAEIVIYTGLTFVVGLTHITWRYVLAFVIMLHITMAKMTHEWYLTNYKNYPRQRKALIPYLW